MSVYCERPAKLLLQCIYVTDIVKYERGDFHICIYLVCFKFCSLSLSGFQSKIHGFKPAVFVASNHSPVNHLQ